MSNRSRSFWVAAWTLALLAPTSTALAWPSVDAAGNRVPLLGGRWTIALPQDTLRATPNAPPDAPPARDELDSLAVYRSTEGNLGVRATLLESTRPDDLEAAVRTLPAPCATPTYAMIDNRADLLAMRCTDVSPDGAFRPITVFAVHPDGWVDRIEGLIETTDPADEMGRAAGVEYAEAVMQTLSAGQVEQPVERGTITLARACEEGDASDPLTLTLPSDWIAIRDTTPLSSLVRMMRVVPLGTARVIVAVELSPSGTAPLRVAEGMGEHRSGTLLGQSVDWLVLQQEGTPIGMRELASELTVTCGAGATPYTSAMRLSLGGPTDRLDEAQHVLETLALGGERGHTAQLVGVSSEEPAIEEGPPETEADADADAEAQGHFWSIAIGGASLLLLGAAFVLRGRTTRPK